MLFDFQWIFGPKMVEFDPIDDLGGSMIQPMCQPPARLKTEK